MPNYKNAKIYKLWSPEGDDIYIGSTTQKLYDRKAGHNAGRGETSKIIYEKYNDVRIELLECFPCENKDELNKKEGEYIRNNKCVNKIIPGRTRQEYREDNKEKLNEKTKEYYVKNKDLIKQKQKEKVNEIITCECGGTYQSYRKLRHQKSKIHLKMFPKEDFQAH